MLKMVFGRVKLLYFFHALLSVGKWQPVRLFGNSRELRQGDLLSHMLFILVMEALSSGMDRVVEGTYKVSMLWLKVLGSYWFLIFCLQMTP